MDNRINLKEELNNIKLSEGDGFVFDEVAIENEYIKVDSNKSSLSIKILSILGGFLATMAFLGFLLVAGLYDSEAGLLTLGIICILTAIFLNIKFDKLIIDTLSISAYLMGFPLLGLGVNLFQFDENAISVLFITIAIISLVITQNYILSFISVLIINGCFLFLIMHNYSYNLIHIYNAVVVLGLTYCFLNEAKIIASNKGFSKLYNPVRIGLLISLIMGLTFVGNRELVEGSSSYIWISSLITIPTAIYVISVILGILGVKVLKTKIIIFAASILFLLPTAFSPAISGSLLIILLSFLVNYKVGSAIGIISFIYFIAQYYYDLDFTLLTKSIILFSSGIIFLLFFLFTFKKLVSNEKV